MTGIVVTPQAERDTIEILTKLAIEAGIVVADRYAASFAILYGRLSRYPQTGARRPRLGPNVRISTVLPYVVLHQFDASADSVAVLRILHGRRRITRRLLRSK